MTKYILADKRLKTPEYETAQERYDKKLRKQRRYARMSVTAKERWDSMSALDRAIHGVKVSEGARKAKERKELLANNPQQVCAGCKDEDTSLYEKVLPVVLWLCPRCTTMYDKHG